MQSILKNILLGVVVSLFFFPVSFAGIPASINSKMILAVCGIVLFLWDSLVAKTLSFSLPIVVAGCFSIVFSLWCYFCIVENGTFDRSYAQYWLSFATWTGSAYAVCSVIQKADGELKLGKVIYLLVWVCVAQCALALLIDNNLAFQRFIDSIFVQGQQFLHEVGRMYGIGAALDSAGVRFCVVLILMGCALADEPELRQDRLRTVFYIVAFMWITVVGSMISRTTGIGAGISLAYLLLARTGFGRESATADNGFFWKSLIIIVILAVGISVIGYHTDPVMKSHLRFAFEGFFNWAETGTFSTSSTDKLNSVMWVWPETTREWIMGTGRFDNWVYSTDIGYCRFTLYCGLVGMVIFGLFFIVNARMLAGTDSKLTVASLLFAILTFLVWIKVSTDIYFIYALLFCASGINSRITEKS